MSFVDRMERRLSSMRAMMEKAGVHMDSFATSRRGLDLVAAIRTCQGCSAGDVCSDWLLRAPARVAQAPAFCPNARRFAQAKADQTARECRA
jgi:hypothetical protein